MWPFSYLNTTERYNEAAEIEWNEQPQAVRDNLEKHARRLKESLLPYANSWLAVEDVFGLHLEADFGVNKGQHDQLKATWLNTIGMNYSSTAKKSLAQPWASIPLDRKSTILENAMEEKEQYCRDWFPDRNGKT